MSGRGAARGGGRGGRGPSGGAARGGGGRGPGRSDAGRGRTDAGRGGGGRGGQSGGRGAPGGGRGRGPPAPQGPATVKEVSTNVVQASISESCFFYMIGLDGQDKKGEQIDSPSRRAFLFAHGLRKLLKDLPEAESKFYMRVSFVQGSTAFCGRKIPNLDEELLLCDGTDTGGDSLRIVRIERFAVPECLTLPADATPAAAGGLKIDQFRCQGSAQTFTTYQDLLQHCGDTGDSPIVIQEGEEVKPAEPAVFLAYINCALQRAMGEILTRWGQDYFDPKEFTEDWGIKIFRAIHMSFSLGRVGGSKSTSLLLTCDLKAKVMRCRSLLDEVNERRQTQVPANSISAAKRKWINSGNSVIYKSDRKRYDVVGLHFDKSPDTLPLADKKMSHTDYFKSKGIALEFPHCPPMVEVKGRRDMSIFLPPELVFEFELDPKTKMKLPQVTSFDPPSRHKAINKALQDLTPPRLVLTPGTKKSIGGSLLPALGIVLKDSRVNLKTLSLPFPSLIAPNVEVFKNEQFSIAKAKYNVDPKQATTLQVVLFYNEYIQGFEAVYGQLRDLVNGMNTKYRFPAKPVAVVETNTNEQHFGAVEKFFAGKAPANVFVLDFANPSRGATDLAYPVIKHALGKGGYLSQFVNWKTCPHDDSSQERKSSPILQGVARQIIQKTGVCLWYVSLPVEVPLPAMFLGIDVFHAPIVFDPKSKKKGRKNSVVAFVFSVIEKFPQKGHPVVTRTYTKTCRRDPGEEVNLADVLEKAVKEATQAMAIQPASLFVYRDGMNETSARHEKAELAGVRKGLAQNPVGGQHVAAAVPVAYVNCQKRVANKFLTVDGQFAAPAGTLITGLQGMTHKTFYINNNAPRGSTGKPTRFELVSRDAALKAVNVEALTYSLCYTYPNWTGLIKVPGPVQCAHKAAELAGCMIDGGDSINAKAFTNTCYYL